MKPARLEPGDAVAIVAPASAPVDMMTLKAGIQKLADRGYRVETGRADFSAVGYLCGDDTLRLNEVNHYLARPDIKAIFCVRGGYGTLRLLGEIDYASARSFPKLIVGYSDITALQLALYAKSGLPGLSGPMVAIDWAVMDVRSEVLFDQLLNGTYPLRVLGPENEELECVRPGFAEGVLLGGNLTLITRLIGTPYLPILRDAILFVEEVGEEPYRVDGLLAHLKLSGVLDSLGGLVIGGLTDGEPEESSPSLTMDEVLAHYTENLTFPVARGLRYGHFPLKNTMPIGVRARLAVDPKNATLTILESVFR